MAEPLLDWDILLLYAPPWFGPTRFSKHHLACYFARRGARVLYVEAPLTPLGIRRGRRFLRELAETTRPPKRVAEKIWLRRHFLPVPYHAVTPLTSRRMMNRIGQRMLAPVIRHDLQRLGLRRPIVIAGLPHAADLPTPVETRALVYHCADDYTHVGGFPPTLPSVEADLCLKSNLVVTTSETLCRSRRVYNPNTHWIPNGADVDHFSSEARPAPDVQHLRRPIVGFVGGLSEWVDLELVADLARRRPNYTFLLVGPISIDSAPTASLPNVCLIGARPYARLPEYLAAMDVALIPFKRNDVTYHADPIKAYEYLAAGLPVVATDLPSLHRLEHVVRQADSPETFLRALDDAVHEGKAVRRDERREEARRHSWDSRFRQMEQLIAQTLACGS